MTAPRNRELLRQRPAILYQKIIALYHFANVGKMVLLAEADRHGGPASFLFAKAAGHNVTP